LRRAVPSRRCSCGTCSNYTRVRRAATVVRQRGQCWLVRVMQRD
jgi:hypothetical protein